MIEHVCSGPACLVCVEAQLYTGVLAPREDEEAPIDAALERAAGELAEEQRLAAERDREEAEEILADADAEIERARAEGHDHFPGKA